MYTSARVSRINGENGTVILKCETDACAGCKAQFFCTGRKLNEYPALNPENIRLTENCRVEVFLPPARTIASVFLVFGLPVLMFPAGFLLFRNVLSAGEFLSAAGGGLAMAVAFGLAAVINIRNRKKLMPVICRIADGNPE